MTTTRIRLATALFGCLLAGAAQAGSCPVDKMVPDGKGQAMSSAPAAGITDTVIATNDLAQQGIGINDRLFRLRRLVVQPGGVVPWHSHGDRPAIIYIISGQITEYASTCRECSALSTEEGLSRRSLPSSRLSTRSIRAGPG